MKLEIDIPEHQYNNIIALNSLSLGRVPYKGIIMYAINAIKNATPVDQEPNVRHCFGCKYSKDNHIAGTEKCHLCMWENQYTPTTKNDLGVDCISREQALGVIRNLYPSMPRVDFSGSLRKWVDKYKPYIECDDAIKQLPSVTPQEPRCKECKWWKDSDGTYRRGIGAESRCPINSHAVYCGDGYCYMFSPKIDMREVEK